METAKILLMACGIYSFAFAIFHGFFWAIFHWKKDLEKISFANKAIMQILNLRLIYIFILVGVSCFLYPQALLQTSFGNFFLLGISGFWLGRTIEQFIFLRAKNPMIHLLTFVFIVGVILFALPVILLHY